ncbi:hypothetical protein [Phenylobacterium sp. J426]|uniref:hypothetical protein n=1 Tax=Phenylobacterium sp. J426 TaxID=2898439 RepID=UPI0027E3269B|nr:hypothetical protein [Phenylobacterium sp. J426]
MCRPLAGQAARLADIRGSVVVGLCGAQGSGKSTIAQATVKLLQAQQRVAIAVSLDDFYLGREARTWLAGQVHPLLATRGPPGTHDVAMACGVLDALAEPSAAALPAFDKSTDERRPKPEWRTVAGPVEVVILEGWCIGAAPQPPRRPQPARQRTGDRGGPRRCLANLCEPPARRALPGAVPPTRRAGLPPGARVRGGRRLAGGAGG